MYRWAGAFSTVHGVVFAILSPGSALARPPPFFTDAVVGFRRQCSHRQRLKLLALQQLRERPYCRAADQRASIIKQPPRFSSQSRVMGVADRDQHIADKAVAADALDRR